MPANDAGRIIERCAALRGRAITFVDTFIARHRLRVVVGGKADASGVVVIEYDVGSKRNALHLENVMYGAPRVEWGVHKLKANERPACSTAKLFENVNSTSSIACSSFVLVAANLCKEHVQLAPVQQPQIVAVVVLNFFEKKRQARNKPENVASDFIFFFFPRKFTNRRDCRERKREDNNGNFWECSDETGVSKDKKELITELNHYSSSALCSQRTIT